ncbi:GNAT family N-acetyltransferase [Sphingomonas radiodurans]|uniref:GNAT family N-acetyltransferase n=1 Tax=Sphingomonas radiodurans TaxID=2890321 RepID=UPI001E45DB43|nr:N-acetyltransferase [Sphingomonas radiodurans]WBH16823.1 N-acetyltransferase [Sphingomonas radiodurans]
MIELVGLETVEANSVERLLDRAFGPDRHGRTAYRLRAGVAALPGPSLAACDEGALVGSIQLWPVQFTGDDGRRVPLILVGPVAVAPDRQRDGIGRMLVAAALARVPNEPLMLIGDPEYYGRFFGFSAEHTAGWRLPGPVEQHRLLARGDAVPTGPGSVGPRIAALA